MAPSSSTQKVWRCFEECPLTLMLPAWKEMRPAPDEETLQNLYLPSCRFRILFPQLTENTATPYYDKGYRLTVFVGHYTFHRGYTTPKSIRPISKLKLNPPTLLKFTAARSFHCDIRLEVPLSEGITTTYQLAKNVEIQKGHACQFRNQAWNKTHVSNDVHSEVYMCELRDKLPEAIL